MARDRTWDRLLTVVGTAILCAVAWAGNTVAAPSAARAAGVPASNTAAASSNIPAGKPSSGVSTQTSSAKLTNDKKIAAAIARGVAFLKSEQGDDGSFTGWNYSRQYPCGETALALLALRSAGVDASDPACVKGTKLLLECAPEKTYVASLMAQVLAMTPAKSRPSGVRMRMTELAKFLTMTQLKDGTWSYGLEKNFKGRTVLSLNNGDNSNTQFAVQALWKLAEAGVDVDQQALRASEKHYLESQTADGGWYYSFTLPSVQEPSPKNESTQGMTTTGLASLHIFTDFLHLHDEGDIVGGAASGCGKTGPLDQRIETGMARAESDLEDFLNRPRKTADDRQLDYETACYLYSIERVGAASGKKYFGTIDWYAAVSKFLLNLQNADGSWGPQSKIFSNNLKGQPQRKVLINNFVETSMALLFLAKGRTPIFFEKLRYDGDWCNDRRDVAHITDYAGKVLERQFNWEVVDLKSKVSGWFDGPVLFFNGHDGPKLTDEEKKKLKEYVDRGGFLFAEACCGQPKFATAVRNLAHELWPDLEWKTLPADHPLFTRASHFDLKKPPTLEGLTDAKGFTFFILSPQDLSCLWNQNLIVNRENQFLLALNVYDYASRRGTNQTLPKQ